MDTIINNMNTEVEQQQPQQVPLKVVHNYVDHANETDSGSLDSEGKPTNATDRNFPVKLVCSSQLLLNTV